MAPSSTQARPRSPETPRKPANIVYGPDEIPPGWLVALLAVQHVFLQFVGISFAVIVARSASLPPDRAQSFVSFSMIAAGIATILQTLKRGPVGAGYLTPEGPDPSFLAASLQAVHAGGAALLYGMTIAAGLFEGLLSAVIYRLRVLFPPEVTGVIVAMVGVSLLPAAMDGFLGVAPGATAPTADPTTTVLSVVILFLIVCTNVWGKGAVRQFALPLGIVVGYAAAAGLGMYTPAQVSQLRDAPLVGFPGFSGLSYSFDARLLLPFLIAITCSTLKNVGDITTCQKVNDANWRRVDMRSVRGGILADAIGTVLGGLLGGMGQASYSANVGLSVATGITSRVVGVATGGLVIALAFLPKLAVAFLIMPQSVLGASLIFGMCFMILAGLQIMTSRMIDARKTFITGIALIFGISVFVVPTGYAGVVPTLRPIFTSSLSLATVLVVVLNALLRLGVARRVSRELTDEPDAPAAARDFLEAQGGRWGARPEVIQRAIAATTEILETVAGGRMARSDLRLSATFDEMSLDVEVSYCGEAMEFPAAAPSREELLETQTGVSRLAGYLARRYADGFSSRCQDDVCRIQLHFDH